jgi:outer membrane murein-binding lipoprotein Lpp
VKHLFKLSIMTASMLAAGSAMAGSPSNAQLQQEIQALTAHAQKLQAEVDQLHAKRGHHGSVVRTARVSHTLNLKASRARHVRLGHLSVMTTPSSKADDQTKAPHVLEQVSGWNEQLTLLQQRADLMKAMGGVSITQPILEISGGLEGQAFSLSGKAPNETSRPRGFNLQTVQLDFNAILGPWMNVFTALNSGETYAQNGTSTMTPTVDRTFATIGNLNKFPVYFSFGQMYTPFGRYSSMMLTAPVTQSLGRTKSDTMIVGVSKDGFYGSAFAYSGYRTTGSAAIKQGGVDAGYTYKFTNPHDAITVGASLESNIADSQGMQSTGMSNTVYTGFNGFGNSSTSNNTLFNVPAISAYTTLALGHWTANAEFMSATRAFNANDLSFARSGGSLRGARVRALHLELNYMIQHGKTPITLGAAYGQTWEALALNLPRYSLTADVQTSLLRNTLETIEYRHDWNYSTGMSGQGRGSAVQNGLGGSGNTVLGQIGIYF